ncbi:MAG: isoprenylcysteine carboxylmethyltransferase family protein [Ignavibacteriae bacterium]|nr:isoprenylcysteine carboxylmethyltransferase family protein [Ignavibacteria bacterium]MBI3363394.1 isoprenylcysteine carboxylmethyltransferase family protein [Ignavibacteriota bacterium]
MNPKLASTFAVAVLVLAVVYLFYTQSLFGHEPIAIGLQIAAFLLMVWARITFGKRSFHAAANPTEGGVVTTGPYRFVRHSIYAAILYFTLVGVLANISVQNIIVESVIVSMLFVRIMSEEKLLLDRYPEYAEYSRKTKRLIPFIF